MAAASRSTSIVDLAQLVVDLGRADAFDLVSRRALRLVCRRLKEAVGPTMTALRLSDPAESDMFCASSLLDYCQKLDVTIKVAEATDANAIVAALAAAALTALVRISLRVGGLEYPAKGVLDLGPLRTASWIQRLQRLDLHFDGFEADFGAFDDLEFSSCTNVWLYRCRGDNVAALWRCLGQRCSAVRSLRLGGMVVSDADFANFLSFNSAKLEHLELNTRGGLSPMPSSTGLIASLAAAALPQLQSLCLSAVAVNVAAALRHAPWLQSVKELSLYSISTSGLAAILAGARGGQLRTLYVSTNDFTGAFADADLPQLTTISVTTWPGDEEGPLRVDATALLSSRLLPKLEKVIFNGTRLPTLIIPDLFAEDDVLPSLKTLDLNFVVLSPAGAAALGRRLPRLASLGILCDQYLSQLCFADMFVAAATYSGEWVTETLSLGSDEFCADDAMGQADLPVLEALLDVAPRMGRLKELHLCGAVGVGGARQWVWAAQKGLWPRLEVLDVGNVGDKGPEALAGCLGWWKRLKKLSVTTATGMKDVYPAEAFPGVDVYMF